MKKIQNRTLLAFLFVSSIIALLSSCSEMPVFANIEKEVKLDPPSVAGSVYALVEFGSDLYVTNGTLSIRSGGTGDWNEVNMPDYMCVDIASNGTSLFIVSRNKNWEDPKVYFKNGSSWSFVPGSEGVERILSGPSVVFGFKRTNTQDLTWSMFALTTTGTSAITGATDLQAPIGGAVIGSNTYIAFRNALYSSDGSSFTSISLMADTKNITGITTDKTDVFITDTSKIYRYDVSEPTVWISFEHTASHATTSSERSLAFLEKGATDVFLIASSTGYKEILYDGTTFLSAQNPGAGDPSSISMNASTQYSSSVGKLGVGKIFITGPAGGNAYMVYASILGDRYNGLWAYYPTTRPEWNRE